MRLRNEWHTNFDVYETDESYTRKQFVELKQQTEKKKKKGKFSLDIDIFMTLFGEN